MEMERGQISLFKIKPGVVKKGYGIDCARPYLSEELIRNAERHWRELIGRK